MNRKEYLYVIHAKDISACKVGRSKNPKKRTREVITGSKIKNYSIYISDPVLDSCVCEKQAHKYLDEFIHLNEWYFCDNDTAINAVIKAVKEHGEKITERFERMEKQNKLLKSSDFYKEELEDENVPELTLKAARVNAGLDQTDVSRKLGVNIATVSSWETGKTKPSLDNFRKLCELYELPEDCIRF